MDRSCGVLLPVFSLPSPCGIGALGRAAYEFIDFLAAAGQSWWQILPVGPTGFGDSPYQSFSSFAGNPYLIDLDLLREDGLLDAEDLAGPWGAEETRVDYGLLYQRRFAVLRKAAGRCLARDRAGFERFCAENAAWLSDYALFMALKRRFGMRPWSEWPDEDVRLRRPAALERYGALLRPDAEFFACLQFLFFGQWDKLRARARQKGVGIIGDLPIYVAMDSADVWSAPGFFQLDGRGVPAAVAGVPPDDFTADGQLWGNPLYDWDAMKRDGYGWWIRRVQGAARLYDMLRLDHFRGLESYWAVPYGAASARTGRWIKGPGMDLVGVLTSWFPDVPFLAEDLGYLTDGVRRLLAASGLPGMKVLEFAFADPDAGAYLPHNYGENCVCYTGTHDNPPLAAWRDAAPAKELDAARAYWGLNGDEGFCRGVLRGGLSSVARLFIAQMQDYLELGADSRVNVPGSAEGNWRWRLAPGQLTDGLAARLAEMARRYGRERRP